LGDFFGNRRLLQVGALYMVVAGIVFVSAALFQNIALLVLAQILAGANSLAVWVAAQSAVTFPESEDEPAKSRYARIAT
jgi:MFS family permease